MEYIATSHITNTFGIGIIEIEHGINDIISFQFVNFELFDQDSEIFTAIIEYDNETPYFIHEGVEYDLNDFIKLENVA